MKKRRKDYKLIVFNNRRNIHIYSHSYLPCSCFQESLKYLTCSKFVVVLNDRYRYSEMTGCLFILLITGRIRCPDRAVEYEQTFCSLLIKSGRRQSPTYVNYPLYRDSFGDSSKLITLITSNETNL